MTAPARRGGAKLAVQVVVIAKEPRPGAVKTRLCPPLTPEQAAELAEAALADTCRVVACTRVQGRVMALEGRTGRWVPPGCDIVVQRTGAFGERLAGAIDDAWALHPLPVLLIGMDTPQLDTQLVESAARALLDPGVDTVLGPANDGGYWLIGAREPVAGMFAGVPMSTDHTAAAQLRRLHTLSLTCSLLPTLRDVDTFEDALAVASASPHTAFARALRGCAVAEEAGV
jgi:hypothetical protein